SAYQSVLDHLIDAVFVTVREQLAHPGFEIAPGSPQRRHVREHVGRQQGCWRLPEPARMPGPLGGVDVRRGIADRAKAAAHVAGELLRRERIERGEQAVSSPIVIIEQGIEVSNVHTYASRPGQTRTN